MTISLFAITYYGCGLCGISLVVPVNVDSTWKYLVRELDTTLTFAPYSGKTYITDSGSWTQVP